LKELMREQFNLTSAASHSSRDDAASEGELPFPKDLGFATQDRSWCALVGDVFKLTYYAAQSNMPPLLCQYLGHLDSTHLCEPPEAGAHPSSHPYPNARPSGLAED
jgi:hypothetical protein